MKKWVKGFILAIASATLCASAVMLTGCTSAKDWLKQQRCEHTWNSGIVTTKATCSDEGETTYTCTKCDKTKKEEIAKLPHVEEIVETKAATCKENGHTDYKKCKVCEEVLVEKKDLPALGHTEIDVAGTDATCTVKGLTDGKYCTRCETYTIKQQEIPALGHTLATLEGKEPTCTETGLTNGVYCKTCNTIYTAQETIKATGHTFGTNGVCQKCGSFESTEACFALMANKTATDVTSTIKKFGKGYYRIYTTFEAQLRFRWNENYNEKIASKFYSFFNGGTSAMQFNGSTFYTSETDAQDDGSFRHSGMGFLTSDDANNGANNKWIYANSGKKCFEIQINEDGGYIDLYLYEDTVEVYVTSSDVPDIAAVGDLLATLELTPFSSGTSLNSSITKIEKYV